MLHSTYTIQQFTDTCDQERCAPSRALGWIGEPEDLRFSYVYSTHINKHLPSLRYAYLNNDTCSPSALFGWGSYGGFHCHYAGLQHSGWLSPTIAHCQNWLNIYILQNTGCFCISHCIWEPFYCRLHRAEPESIVEPMQTYFKLQGRHLLPRCLICHA